MKLTSILLFTALTANSHAMVISLTNSDFEATANLGPNQVIDGWSEADGTSATLDPNYAEGGIVGGSVAGFLKANDGNWIGQDLAGVNATSFGSYILTLDYGYRTAATPLQTDFAGDVTIRVSLWNATDSVELVRQDIAITNPGAVTPNILTNTAVALNYDNSVEDSGDLIQVRITHGGPSGADLNDNGGAEDRGWRATAYVDNVSLEAIPEPSTGVLAALAVFGLMGRRRR